MQASEQTNMNTPEELTSSRDTSVSDARWMLGFVALLGAGVLALGLLAELLISSPTL